MNGSTSPTVKGERLLGVIPLEWRYDLTRHRLIRRIVESRWMPLSLLLVNLFIFTVILMAGLTGGLGPGNYNFGIMMIWILWWVMLMLVLVPVFSRGWCTMCPLPLFGEWLQRGKIVGVRQGKLFGLNKRWPKALSNMWVMNVLFLMTTFASAFFTTRPIATFILMALIIVAAIVMSLIYQKRTFCLYVCPVSGFQGLYANFGMTEVRVKDPSICVTHTPKTCVTGSDQGYGCPWALLPFQLARNTYCGMCFECIKTCPYDNMVINLRPPGTDLLVDKGRRMDEAWKAFIMLGIAINYFVTFQGPWGFLKDWVNAKTWGGYAAFLVFHTAITMAVIPAAFLLASWLSKLLAGDRAVPLKKVFVNASYTLIPLGLAAWVAFSFGILFPNSSYILHVLSDPFNWGWNLFGTANVPWTPFWTGAMPLLQAAAMLVGLLFSMDFGVKLARQTFPKGASAGRGAIPILAFLALASGLLVWIFIG